MELKPGIRQKGNSFEFTISLGFDGNGKQIRKYRRYTPPEGLTERQLKQVVEAAYDDFKRYVNGNKSLKDNMTLLKLGEMYFSEYAPNKLKKVTAYTYKGTFYSIIVPKLGQVRLKNLTTTSITSFLLEQAETKKPETVRKYKIVLHSILNYAISQGFIQYNPCQGTIWNSDVEGEYDTKDNYLTEDQVKLLMKLTEEYSTFNTIVRLLSATGMRSGECLGLRWDCVNFERKTILINKTLAYITGDVFLSNPKTEESSRTISIEDETVELLKKHKAEQDKLKEIVGDAWIHPECVFTTSTGNYYNRTYLNTQFRNFLKKHPELPKITIHGLRHTYASLLLVAGEDIDVVSKILGHSSSEITSRIYSHILVTVRVRVAKKIASILYS